MRAGLYRIESKETFGWLMFVLLLGTNFLGLMPFAGFVNINTKPVILIKCLIFLFFAVETYNPRNKIDRWLLYLWIAFALNKVSSVFFRGQSISEVPFQGSFIYDFGFYYILSYIKPSVRQIEKAIICLGFAALILYFVQYVLLPTPILESLTEGWRSSESVSEFDIERFSVTGEILISLLGLFYLNKYLLSKKLICLLVVIGVFVFTILHGYRSVILAYVITCLLLYFKINGFHFNRTTISLLMLLFCFLFLLNFTPIFDDILGTINEKNERQSALSFQEIDRVIEFKYFYDNIGKPFEWLFGAGFLGKNLTDLSSFINWVDLGFIGLSFMGGILLTICWIRLLCFGIRSYQLSRIYVNVFFLYIIFSTILLPTAFNNKSIVVQCLMLYAVKRMALEKGKGKRDRMIQMKSNIN